MIGPDMLLGRVSYDNYLLHIQIKHFSFIY